MELVSMTDYLLKIRGMITSELCREMPQHFRMPVWKGDKDEMVKDMLALDAQKWNLVGEYAKFLKTPLHISMFIVVDCEDNPLEDPRPKPGERIFREMIEQYEACSERVLFEGLIKRPINKNGSFSLETEKGQISYYKQKPKYWVFNNYNTIEDLTDLGLTIKESAIKKYRI